MAISLDLEKFGNLLGGWTKKGGEAAEYTESGSNFRTYKPAFAPTQTDGLYITTKIDHIRGGAADDHAQVDLTLTSAGKIENHRVQMQIQGNPHFDTGLVTEAAKLAGSEAGDIAKVAAEITNSVIDFFSQSAETGGRTAFPSIVQWNILNMAYCVTGLAEPLVMPPPKEAQQQAGWRYCYKCMGLFFGEAGSLGVCSAGGTHDPARSGNYVINIIPGENRQAGWRYCYKCMGLFFGEAGSLGVCSAGGTHDPARSGDYSLGHDDQSPGQEGWRYCRKCQGLFYAEAASLGACPAGETHDPEGSWAYRVVHT